MKSIFVVALPLPYFIINENSMIKSKTSFHLCKYYEEKLNRQTSSFSQEYKNIAGDFFFFYFLLDKLLNSVCQINQIRDTRQQKISLFLFSI